MISGGALIITNLSNMVTGQEIEIANHISRFIGLWVILLVVFLLSFDNFQYSKFLNLSRIKQLSSLVVIGVFCWIAIPNVIDFLPSLVNRVTDLRADNVRNLQAVAKPLTWLETNAQPESVIWTDRWISYYVPSRTHHYVLFSPGGGLHLMPSAELVDRYLVANYFRDLTVDDLKNDFRSYAGVGNAIHQYKTNNRRVQLCLFFRFDYWGYNCGQMADSFSWRGEQYFLDLEKKYQTDIKPHINQKLVYYQVAYILIDKVEDKLKLPIANISNQTLLYQDQRFEIYGVNQVGQTRVTGS
ncbi:MAG: hypothetical protein UW78_C0024G0007 [Candidatus Azambacteria bacterium GW2011_GWA1_44_9]|uniref:Uncharacterized protein n=1 Tax=Candidatus Azambacteria bacterium GW2011_GWA1_44_9 TaxID=1618610 RepID=A0A0G1MJ16_9BACT|nr:MAG: hypothetical protein UW78_C0024G0007 [Candidatus Azambacteria bacterium GW2011_GWA1_44_9]